MDTQEEGSAQEFPTYKSAPKVRRKVQRKKLKKAKHHAKKKKSPKNKDGPLSALNFHKKYKEKLKLIEIKVDPTNKEPTCSRLWGDSGLTDFSGKRDQTPVSPQLSDHEETPRCEETPGSNDDGDHLSRLAKALVAQEHQRMLEAVKARQAAGEEDRASLDFTDKKPLRVASVMLDVFPEVDEVDENMRATGDLSEGFAVQDKRCSSCLCLMFLLAILVGSAAAFYFYPRSRVSLPSATGASKTTPESIKDEKSSEKDLKKTKKPVPSFWEAHKYKILGVTGAIAAVPILSYCTTGRFVPVWISKHFVKKPEEKTQMAQALDTVKDIHRRFKIYIYGGILLATLAMIYKYLQCLTKSTFET